MDFVLLPTSSCCTWVPVHQPLYTKCLQVWFSIIWTHLIIFFWNWSPCECLVVVLLYSPYIVKFMMMFFLSCVFSLLSFLNHHTNHWFWHVHIFDFGLWASVASTSDCTSMMRCYFVKAKPKSITRRQASRKMTLLTPSIFTRALVLLWASSRVRLSGDRSWNPSPLFGLHGWTMGKDKLLKKSYPEGERGGIIKGLTFYLLSSHFVCVCDYSERGEDKRHGPQWWRDLKRGEIISNGILHTHTHFHCPRPYSAYPVQSRILLHHAVFS